MPSAPRKTSLGFALPLAVFLLAGGGAFALFYRALGREIITFFAPPLVGVAAALLCLAALAPARKWRLMRELRRGGPRRIAHWQSALEGVEFYLAENGCWFNGRGYTWNDLYTTLQNVELREADYSGLLRLTLRTARQKQVTSQTLEIPVPRKALGQARAALPLLRAGISPSRAK